MAPRRISLLVCLLPIILASCSSGSSPAPKEPSPALGQPGGPNAPVYLTKDGVPNGQPVTYGSIMLCVTGPGNAVITHVAIHGLQGNLRVDAFSTRTMAGHPNSLGEVEQPLASVGDGFNVSGPQQVSDLCPADAQSGVWADLVELAVEVTRTSGDVAGGPALDVTYTAGGVTGTYTVPFGISLCALTCAKPSGW